MIYQDGGTQSFLDRLADAQATDPYVAPSISATSEPSAPSEQVATTLYTSPIVSQPVPIFEETAKNPLATVFVSSGLPDPRRLPSLPMRPFYPTQKNTGRGDSAGMLAAPSTPSVSPDTRNILIIGGVILLVMVGLGFLIGSLST